MAARVVRWFKSSEVDETKSSGNKFSPLKKRNDEREASESGDHEIMNISYTPTSSPRTFKEGIDRITKFMWFKSLLGSKFTVARPCMPMI